MSSTAATHLTPIQGTLLLTVSLEPQEIGQRIAAARIRKGWTQLQFAMEANVSPSTIARWEAGKLPPVRELARIADVLDVDVSEFVEPGEKDAPVTAEELAGLRADLRLVREGLDRVETLLRLQREDESQADGGSP